MSAFSLSKALGNYMQQSCFFKPTRSGKPHWLLSVCCFFLRSPNSHPTSWSPLGPHRWVVFNHMHSPWKVIWGCWRPWHDKMDSWLLGNSVPPLPQIFWINLLSSCKQYQNLDLDLTFLEGTCLSMLPSWSWTEISHKCGSDNRKLPQHFQIFQVAKAKLFAHSQSL